MRTLEEIIYLPEFADARKSMRRAARKVLTEASQPYPSDLLHFTDMAGLVGILTSRKLWASYAHSLNDETEIICGVQAADQALRTISNNSQRTLLLDSLPHLNFRNAAYGIFFSPYVVSFCKNEGSAQWLHYGHSGTGVAMKFSAAGLREHPSADLCRVIYDSEKQRQIIVDIVAAIHSEYERLANITPASAQGYAECARAVSINYLMIAIALMKKPEFAVEEEWRLVHLRGRLMSKELVSDAKFRSSHNRVRPYLEITYQSPFPFSTAILGYSCPENEESPSLRALFWEMGSSQLDRLYRSQVAVRP